MSGESVDMQIVVYTVSPIFAAVVLGALGFWFRWGRRFIRRVEATIDAVLGTDADKSARIPGTDGLVVQVRRLEYELHRNGGVVEVTPGMVGAGSTKDLAVDSYEMLRRIESHLLEAQSHPKRGEDG